MKPRVALINMPFAAPDWPSIGLGLLKSHLADRGVAARVFNFNLSFAERIGLPRYREIASSTPTAMVGEWIFSRALWEACQRADEEFFELLAAERGESPYARPGADAWSTREALLDIRESVEPLLDECLHAVPWGELDIVGFTSIFQQQMASLALAQRIKRLYPDVCVTFGGANCEGPMGAALLRTFPFVDTVFSGEADATFPEFVARMLEGEPPLRRQGVLRRGTAASLNQDRGEVAAPIDRMDELPIPDYAEYFDALDRGQFSGVDPQILFESSRGCWWGAKSHCTFCGLNDDTLGFRHKSVERAISEIRTLVARHGHLTRKLQAVDNIIPHSYLTEFLERLKGLELGLDVFYESKANLRKEHVAAYRDAGVRNIQPGIESLSTPVLKRMRKGITGIQNVQLLKWTRQFGVQPHWNYLFGFPGESPSDYDGQAELLQSIVHFFPPGAWGPVRFDRFSPYLTQPDALGLRHVRHCRAYRIVYRGVDDATLRDFAYYFEAEFDGQGDVGSYVGRLCEVLKDWVTHADEHALFMLPLRERLLIFDLRPGAVEAVVGIEGARRTIIEACDGITHASSLRTRVDLDEPALLAEIAWLIERRLLIEEDGRYLSLVIPLGFEYSPSGRARELLLSAMRSGTPTAVPIDASGSHVTT